MQSQAKVQNIVIVDDDTALSRSTKSLLETRNYHVTMVSSIHHFETAHRPHDHDIILLNLNSKNQTPYKFLNRILHSKKTPKLILTTPSRSQLRPDDIFPGKSVTILVQPVAPSDLIKAVETASMAMSVFLRT